MSAPPRNPVFPFPRPSAHSIHPDDAVAVARAGISIEIWGRFWEGLVSKGHAAAANAVQKAGLERFGEVAFRGAMSWAICTAGRWEKKDGGRTEGERRECEGGISGEARGMVEEGSGGKQQQEKH